MEMRVGDSHNWGIGYYQFNKESEGIGRTGFNTLDISSILNPINGRGAILGFGSKEKVQISTGAGKLELTSLIGFINFIKTVAKTNILATPQIIAMDNEEASFEAGERVPVSQTLTVGTTNSPATRSTNFEDATIHLKLIPHISPKSDKVRLKIEQNIKQLSNSRPQAKDLQDSAVILSKRNIKTNVVVPSGDTVVLGGLYQNSEITSTTKIPLLGDIPILGWFFKSQTFSVDKTNLLIFITPTILRSKEGRKDLLEQKLSERMDFIDNTSRGGYDPFVETVEKITKSSSSRKKGSPRTQKEEEDREKNPKKGTPIPIQPSQDEDVYSEEGETEEEELFSDESEKMEAPTPTEEEEALLEGEEGEGGTKLEEEEEDGEDDFLDELDEEGDEEGKEEATESESKEEEQPLIEQPSIPNRKSHLRSSSTSK